VVSFSAGKDSQVILDIVSKVIPPEDYIVIFTDTTMEIPPTYEAFEETKRKYRETYPELKVLHGTELETGGGNLEGIWST